MVILSGDCPRPGFREIWSGFPSVAPRFLRKAFPFTSSSVLLARSRVAEKEDSAECSGSSTEPGRDHVQPPRLPGDAQVKIELPLVTSSP